MHDDGSCMMGWKSSGNILHTILDPRRRGQGVNIMSTPSDKEQIYAITRYLEGLSEGQSASAKNTIAELNTKLSSIFSTDTKSVDNFLALDYGSDLSDILNAGVSSLNVRRIQCSHSLYV